MGGGSGKSRPRWRQILATLRMLSKQNSKKIPPKKEAIAFLVIDSLSTEEYTFSQIAKEM